MFQPFPTSLIIEPLFPCGHGSCGFSHFHGAFSTSGDGAALDLNNKKSRTEVASGFVAVDLLPSCCQNI